MASRRIESRVAALERELANIKARLQDAAAKPWWERIAGTFANDRAFDEAMRLGREYRASQRPTRNGLRKHR